MKSYKNYLEGLGIVLFIAIVCVFAWYTKHMLENPDMEGFSEETGIYLIAEKNGYEIKNYKKIEDPIEGYYMKLQAEAGESYDLYLSKEKDPELFGNGWKETYFDKVEFYTVYSDSEDNGLVLWKDTGWYFYLEKPSFHDETELTDMRTILQNSIWRNG